MLDLFLFAFVMATLALGVKRPFIWVLAYLYIDILAPQKIGWVLMPAIPVSLIAFCAAFAGWLLTDSKRETSVSARQMLMVFLLIWCAITTGWSEFPIAAAEKWDWVWKALVFAIFLPFTLTTRLRIEGAALVMVLTAGAIIISAGIKTVMGGGGYDVLALFVRDNSGIYETSTLSTVAVAIIPLILWFTRHGTIFAPDWRVKLFCYSLVFACLLTPVGTVARTGLLCIAVLMVLALRDVKRRAMFVIAAGMLGIVALPFLPQSYYDRMATIGSYDGDQSASTRVAVWSWTLDYVEEKPLGGGFDAYRANRFEYRMPVREGEGNQTSVRYEKVVDEARAYHSSFFEMLGEQGWPGFFAWMLLQAMGLIQMERIRRRWRGRSGAREQWQAPLATSLQYAQIIYLVGATFQGIAYQPFILMLIGVQIGLWTYCKRLDKPQRARRQALPVQPAPAA